MKLAELFEAEEKSILSVMGKQPEEFKGTFHCDRKGLTSLKGAPSSVSGGFTCNGNHLTSFEGAPSFIKKWLICEDNNFTSLHNIHKHIKHLDGYAGFEENPIRSHVLGVLLIDGLERIFLDTKNVQNIINKH